MTTAAGLKTILLTKCNISVRCVVVRICALYIVFVGFAAALI